MHSVMNGKRNMDSNQPFDKKPAGDKNPKYSHFIKVFILGVMTICIAGAAILIIWARVVWRVPLAETLNLAGVPAFQFPNIQGSTTPSKQPLCGSEPEWFVMLVGLDSREQGSEYLYGLADVIRIARVDFTEPRVNVVSLPRALLVNIPEDLILVTGPLLLNQSYFYGTRGMGYYTGSGYGAGSLAETIQYNFGITANHYLVVNFQAFVMFIDTIGGIDIDLPTYIDDRPNAYFPPGKQHLNGESALTLARIRKKYSDLVRINDQSLIINAIFQRLKDPAILTRLPAIYASLKDLVIMDVSPAQLETALCLFNKLEENNLNFYDPGWDLIIDDWEYIPTLKRDMEILRWDQKLVDWLYLSLWSK